MHHRSLRFGFSRSEVIIGGGGTARNTNRSNYRKSRGRAA
jgi:hypothetical protein